MSTPTSTPPSKAPAKASASRQSATKPQANAGNKRTAAAAADDGGKVPPRPNKRRAAPKPPPKAPNVKKGKKPSLPRPQPISQPIPPFQPTVNESVRVQHPVDKLGYDGKTVAKNGALMSRYDVALNVDPRIIIKGVVEGNLKKPFKRLPVRPSSKVKLNKSDMPAEEYKAALKKRNQLRDIEHAGTGSNLKMGDMVFARWGEKMLPAVMVEDGTNEHAIEVEFIDIKAANGDPQRGPRPFDSISKMWAGDPAWKWIDRKGSIEGYPPPLPKAMSDEDGDESEPDEASVTKPNAKVCRPDDPQGHVSGWKDITTSTTFASRGGKSQTVPASLMDSLAGGGFKLSKGVLKLGAEDGDLVAIWKATKGGREVKFENNAIEDIFWQRNVKQKVDWFKFAAGKATVLAVHATNKETRDRVTAIGKGLRKRLNALAN